MPLESLGSEQINIHDLILEEEKKPMPEWQKQYKTLKDTALFDKEEQQWRMDMKEDQTLGTSNLRPSLSQLLGVLIETKSDKSLAKEMYNELKKTPLYDSEKNQWNDNMKDGETFMFNRLSTNQLLGVLVEAQFNKEEAQKLLNTNRKTPFFDAEKKHWKLYLREDVNQANPYRLSSTELVSILTEAQFDKNLAREMYDTLKKTPLYDEEREQWNGQMDMNENIDTSYRYANNQLLGVLIESQFNKASAKKLYEKLKKTKLYDEKIKQWNASIGEDQEIKSSSRGADAQLLGILCEQEFEEQKPDLNNTTTPLPEKRSY